MPVSLDKRAELKKPPGKVSPKLPQKKASKVCFTRPARKDRRVYTPTDLKRIYRYVVGSYGWEAATCAILEESGIQEMLNSAESLATDQALCSYSLDFSDYVQYLPSGADSALGLDPGTIETALTGCSTTENGGLSFGAQLRAVVAILIIVWGVWRQVKASRLYKWVIRRLIIFLIAFEVVDRLERFLEAFIPVVLIMSDALSILGGICDGKDNPPTST